MTPDEHDAALPDGALRSGGDEGEPGERLLAPLDDRDRELLDALAASGEPSVRAVEDDEAAARAAADDAPLPIGDGGPQGDGLEPSFHEPDDGD